MCPVCLYLAYDCILNKIIYLQNRVLPSETLSQTLDLTHRKFRHGTLTVGECDIKQQSGRYGSVDSNGCYVFRCFLWAYFYPRDAVLVRVLVLIEMAACIELVLVCRL